MAVDTILRSAKIATNGVPAFVEAVAIPHDQQAMPQIVGSGVPDL
jgi:hypothetical protein